MSRYIVRYGSMRSLGVMTTRGEDASYRRGNAVIVRSQRGLEIGQVLCEAGDDALTHLDSPPTGQIVRLVTGEDANEVNRIDGSRLKKIETVQKQIEQHRLDMKLVDVEQLFGGERMIVFYLADDRVDFRELVKVLATEFQTRIEMKQIGVRDEAKLLADYGDCGKPVCCNNHLVTMPPVSMKMAKLQKATLDPTKISGRCGRLKCCLRYEFDHYEESHKAMPSPGVQIVTRDGKARVIAQRVLLEQLLVETEDHRRIVIDASEVLSVIKREQPRSKSSAGSSSGSSGGSSSSADGRSSARSRSEDSENDRGGSDSTTTRSRPSARNRSEPSQNKPNRDRHRSPEARRRPSGDRNEGTSSEDVEVAEAETRGADVVKAAENRPDNRGAGKTDSKSNDSKPKDASGQQQSAAEGSPSSDSGGIPAADANAPENSAAGKSGNRRRTRRGGKRNRKKRGGGGDSGGGNSGGNPPA